MFGISFEHLLIVGIILVIVGPKRLPELGNTMGKAIKNFKDSFGGIEEASFKRLLNPDEQKKEEQRNTSQTAAGNPVSNTQATDTASPAQSIPTAQLASGGVSVPANSPIASVAPLAAGTASVTDSSKTDPHQS